MNNNLLDIRNKIYDKVSFKITEFENEPESKEYDACRFNINRLNIVCRSAKITPKKVGQFVTFWKRNKDGITEPLDENDQFDFYMINVSKENRLGQFIFPKSILIEKRIVTTSKKDGKRGFRVYPSWDTAINAQAIRTQKWQLDYFVEFNDDTDLKVVEGLFRS